ncbi:adaptin N terminal region-domain-containing protein [Dunaliella salina]|uniref:Adaptin N terminal region-domain-containing protein n=1 Tax=Dunaliella salina TaxID=3046 RepID=A0ABQ7H1K9_DUNSA|nr:adaptin N terminal region-domain-containing protein [Dunaliella salina]|eukprot:KAF5840736.1 adaptin N terminal region-domain-containing protein [Dunaliella salina]
MPLFLNLQVMRRTDTNHTIGNAIIYECVRTATTIYPNPPLLAAAADAVAKLLRSTSHNLRYVGIDALAGIVKINPQHAHEHQLAVVNCLEDPDDTLKLKTLELLYKMTRANNVEVIVERMMGYLRTSIDEHIRRDISRKVSELAERYAPSPTWFMTVISEVLELGGNHLEPALAHSLMKLIAEQDEDMHRSAVDIYTRLLDAPTTKMPDLLLQVIVWVMGEYGHLAAANPGPRALTPSQVMTKLVNLLNRQKAGDLTRALLIPALGKLCVQGHCGLPPEAEAFVSVASRSSDVELQQRAYELQALLTAPQEVQRAALPQNQASVAYSDDELAAVEELSFLTSFVNQALQNGSAPYVPPEERASAALGGGPEPAASSKGGLRFEAYEPAFFSAGSPAASASKIVDPFSQVPSTRAPAVRGVGAGHSRTSSGSSTTAAPGEPQLRGASRGGAPRWGPVHFDTPGSARTAGGSSAAAAAGSSGGGVDLLSGLVEAATASTAPQQQQQQQPDLLMQLDDDGPPAGAVPATQQATPLPASVDMLLDVGPTQGPPPQQQPMQPPAAFNPATPAAAFNPAAPNMGLPGLSPAMLGGPTQPGAALGATSALPLHGLSWSPVQPLAHPPPLQQQQLGQYGMAGWGMGMGGGMRPPTQPAHTVVSRGGQSMVPSKQPQEPKANADPFSDLLG